MELYVVQEIRKASLTVYVPIRFSSSTSSLFIPNAAALSQLIGVDVKLLR